MIIGIDGNEANTKEKVGVHQYAYEILWGMYKLQDIKRAGVKFVIYLKESPRKDMPKGNNYWEYKIIRGKGLWVLTKLMPELLKSSQTDVLFAPHHYLPFFSRCPKVCMIHDLGYLNFSGQFRKKDYWQLKIWSAISIIISKYIIAPSESTKKDIVRHYPFAEKKVLVVFHGYNSLLFNQNISQKIVRQVAVKYRISSKYLLFLSTLKPSKNIEGLLDAFAAIRKDFNYKLVIAGKKGWFYDSIFEKCKNLGLDKEVIFTDYLSEEDKPALIKGAKVFILPSFWEGFGMDIINAMACGVPVVVSNRASLPEVAGGAGIYIEPDDVNSLVNGIRKVLEMGNREYNRLSQKCIGQAARFSWEKSAKDTLSILLNA
jgi:glycosyltransferase involved in cell wall biosynthesis